MAEMLQSERVQAVRDTIMSNLEWTWERTPSGKDGIVVYLNIDGAVRSYEIKVRERFV